MPMASRESPITRGVVVKSPSFSAPLSLGCAALWMAFWIRGNILRLHALEQPAQGVDQARTGIAQLGPVYDREAPQNRFSWHRQSHSYLAPVGHAPHSFDQASLLQPVDQPDRAVVPD